jgi:glutaredoxin
MIIIWGKPQCPHCDQAKAFCERNNLAYEYKQLDVDFTREELFEKFPNARTFPQITVDYDAEYIGGYTEFETWSKGYKLL